MKRSRRTSTAGIAAASCVLLLAIGPRIGLDLSDTLQDILEATLAGSIAALGLSARDANVTSEGTDARIRRRAGYGRIPCEPEEDS